MTNIVPFPKKPVRWFPRHSDLASRQPYEFDTHELTKLCRWYSAMRYAFPRVQGVMAVSHSDKVSAIGLYGEGGTTPNCLLSKHESSGRTYILWATEQDPPRVIPSLDSITEAQINAIEPPPDETVWLDAAGWTKIFDSCSVAGPSPAF